MKKSVFSRLDDRKTKSRRQILLFAVVFFVVTRLVMMIAVAFAARLYFLYGFDAMSALRFDGSIEGMAYTAAEYGVWGAAAWFLLGAPLFEECAFRLGLSFRRPQAAVGAGALAAFFVSRFAEWRAAAAAGAVVAAAVWFLTTDGQWESLRGRWFRTATLLSSVLFGTVHLFAMHGLSLAVLPFALLICMMMFFAGATFAYLRVNLGFWWGFAAHAAVNLPVVLLLASMSI